jgi:hypothetical protein
MRTIHLYFLSFKQQEEMDDQGEESQAVEKIHRDDK